MATIKGQKKSSDNELDSIQTGCQLSANIGIRWQGQDCLFTDWRYLGNINLWRDYLPMEFERQLPGKKRGATLSAGFAAGDLVDGRQASRIKSIERRQFQPDAEDSHTDIPAVGRFYPQDGFRDVAGIYRGNKSPCRIIAIDNEILTVDFNHPLASRELTLLMHIDSIRSGGAERGGRCNDIPAAVCDLGPGMQDHLPGKNTDFYSGAPYSRADESDDGQFFIPSMVKFWDRLALSRVTDAYNTLVPPNSEILDLMAGVHSPLQESAIKPKSVVGVGLNLVELENNPIYSRHVVLDVNTISALPFDVHAFDAVLIHAAVEYCTQPGLLFTEISRVLRPSGKVIVSFSDRFITEKAINAWTTAYEFERPALVLDYLRGSDAFTRFECSSQHGVLRPEDDSLADKLLYSDAVFIVSAEKRVDHK